MREVEGGRAHDNEIVRVWRGGQGGCSHPQAISTCRLMTLSALAAMSATTADLWVVSHVQDIQAATAATQAPDLGTFTNFPPLEGVNLVNRRSKSPHRDKAKRRHNAGEEERAVVEAELWGRLGHNCRLVRLYQLQQLIFKLSADSLQSRQLILLMCRGVTVFRASDVGGRLLDTPRAEAVLLLVCW